MAVEWGMDRPWEGLGRRRCCRQEQGQGQRQQTSAFLRASSHNRCHPHCLLPQQAAAASHRRQSLAFACRRRTRGLRPRLRKLLVGGRRKRSSSSLRSNRSLSPGQTAEPKWLEPKSFLKEVGRENMHVLSICVLCNAGTLMRQMLIHASHMNHAANLSFRCTTLEPLAQCPR